MCELLSRHHGFFVTFERFGLKRADIPSPDVTISDKFGGDVVEEGDLAGEV